MRSHHNRLILLKTALPDKCGDALLNTLAIGDKGGERVVKVRTEVRPEGLVGNATGDLLSIHYRALYQHSHHKPQTICNVLLSKELQRPGSHRQGCDIVGQTPQ